jgi:hypothetical protein
MLLKSTGQKKRIKTGEIKLPQDGGADGTSRFVEGKSLNPRRLKAAGKAL